MRILMIGDVIGKPRRDAVSALLPDPKREKAIDFVIWNGENAASPRTLPPNSCRAAWKCLPQVTTSGTRKRSSI